MNPSQPRDAWIRKRDSLTAASGADQPTLRDQLDVDRLAERLRDLTYRGRNMTGPEAATYARFLLPLIEADRERAKAEALEEAAKETDEYAAHAATEAREWAPDAHWVNTWEGKQSAYTWSSKLLRDRAASLRATTGQPPDGAGT